MDESTRYTTPEAAVLKAVDEAGGAKRVGVTLRPEYENSPDTASRWVHHCCGDGNRSKFGLRQIVWIFRAACRAGFHAGFIAFARLCGYLATPLDEIAQVRQIRAEAFASLQSAQRLLETLDGLTPEKLALAKAMNLNVEVM